jgi:hypothetical protein
MISNQQSGKFVSLDNIFLVIAIGIKWSFVSCYNSTISEIKRLVKGTHLDKSHKSEMA